MKESEDTSLADPDPGRTRRMLGVALVIGAVATNVFGFRYSRWAVGKELHRGWERRERRRASSFSSKTAERVRPESGWTPHASATFSGMFGGTGTRPRDDHRASGQTDSRSSRRTASDQDTESAQERAWRDWDYAEQMRQFEEARRRRSRGTRARYYEFDRGQTDDRVREELLEKMRRDFGAFEHWRQAGSGGASAEEYARMFGGAEWARRGERAGRGAGAYVRRGAIDYYRVLGVTRGATDREIRAAFREKAKLYHPDAYTGTQPSDAAAKFQEVTRAYDALKDAERRRQYDATGAA